MKFYESERVVTLYHGDCIEVMKNLPENFVDSIVTDPPYELGFMGKSWDSSGVAFNVDVWKEALRVLKPGGHLIAFSGSRTYHRMAVAIEDAGFEIRDQIMWIYGSGFPKSLDVSKAIDKVNGEPNRLLKFTNWMRTTGLKAKQLDEATGTNMGGHYLTTASQPAIPTVALWKKIRPLIAEVPDWVDELVQRIEAEREVIATKPSSLGGTVAAGERNQKIIDYHKDKIVDITIPATAEAKQWQGWGTALKPAHEPMVLARKPLIGTVAANVLTYGTGGLNIDGARVGRAEGDDSVAGKRTATFGTQETESGGDGSGGWEQNESGRWPANLIHDGSDEVVELFPNTAGNHGGRVATSKFEFGAGNGSKIKSTNAKQDFGSAARFFYCAKASKRDRNEGLDGFEAKPAGSLNMRTDAHSVANDMATKPMQNFHPTVKPTDLMRYLINLVTPPGGTVLDPFMGSGSTGKAAIYENKNFVGIEMTEEYLPIAKARIEFAINEEEGKL
jgi:DNA modification methylase